MAVTVYATGDSIRSEGNLPVGIDDTILAPHIATASMKMKRLITDAVYSANLDIATKPTEFADLQKAESNLALSYAIYALNIETQGNGILRTKGWDQSRSELLSQSECDKLSEHFYDIAMEVLEAYVPAFTGDPNITEDDDDIFQGGNFNLIAV